MTDLIFGFLENFQNFWAFLAHSQKKYQNRSYCWKIRKNFTFVGCLKKTLLLERKIIRFFRRIEHRILFLFYSNELLFEFLFEYASSNIRKIAIFECIQIWMLGDFWYSSAFKDNILHLLLIIHFSIFSSISQLVGNVAYMERRYTPNQLVHTK